MQELEACRRVLSHESHTELCMIARPEKIEMKVTAWQSSDSDSPVIILLSTSSRMKSQIQSAAVC